MTNVAQASSPAAYGASRPGFPDYGGGRHPNSHATRPPYTFSTNRETTGADIIIFRGEMSLTKLYCRGCAKAI